MISHFIRNVCVANAATKQQRAHGIFVDLETQDVSDLLGDAHPAELRIAALHLDDGATRSVDGPFGSGFRLRGEGQNSTRCLRWTNAWWSRSSCRPALDTSPTPHACRNGSARIKVAVESRQLRALKLK
jgi:hypothetical protein